jgi:hypothetical protein
VARAERQGEMAPTPTEYLQILVGPTPSMAGSAARGSGPLRRPWNATGATRSLRLTKRGSTRAIRCSRAERRFSVPAAVRRPGAVFLPPRRGLSRHREDAPTSAMPPSGAARKRTFSALRRKATHCGLRRRWLTKPTARGWLLKLRRLCYCRPKRCSRGRAVNRN